MSAIYEPIHSSECKSAAGLAEIFAEMLRVERDRLRSELRLRKQNLQADRVAPDDDGPLSHEQFVSILQGDLAQDKLKAVEWALARLGDGQYAICQECGECISEKRLRAIPWAAYCINCQDRMRRPLAA